MLTSWKSKTFFRLLGLLDTTQCLEDLATDTEEGLCDIQDCVEQVKETLVVINAFVHPCRGEGWEEVINVDYTIDGATCPDEWQVSTDARLTVRGCSRTTFAGEFIDSFSVSANGMEYDEVCGRINGYSFDAPSAFDTGVTSIDGVYMLVGYLSRTAAQVPIRNTSGRLQRRGLTLISPNAEDSVHVTMEETLRCSSGQSTSVKQASKIVQ
jgi:hypothetical protein